MSENKSENKDMQELNPKEMESASGGGISEVFQAIGMAWDIYNCEHDNHSYEWKGELENVTHFTSPYYWQNRILVCTKCGKKKVSDYREIVGDFRVPTD